MALARQLQWTATATHLCVNRHRSGSHLTWEALTQEEPRERIDTTTSYIKSDTKPSDSLGHGQTIWTWFNGIVCWHLHHPLPERSFYPGRPKRWFRWSWFPLGHQCTWSIAIPERSSSHPHHLHPKSNSLISNNGINYFLINQSLIDHFSHTD